MARTVRSLLYGTVVCTLLLAGCSGSDAESTTSTTFGAPTSAVATSEPATTAGASTTVATTTAPTTSTPTSTATPTTTRVPPPTTSTTLAGPDTVTITVSVTDGEVSGPGRVTVPFGAQIRLTVSSDEADEVHFHGYDRFADVAPGAPAIMILLADIPGVFEVELEGRGLELVVVEVK